MAQTPPIPPESRKLEACPRCTNQIPAGTRVCPHCNQELKDVETRDKDFKKKLKASRESPGWRTFRDALRGPYGKAALAAVPVMLALVVLYLVYGRWAGLPVHAAPNPALPLSTAQEKVEDTVRLRVSVTNRGEDVPDLSLKSVAVMVEVVHKDGRRVKKRMFPKSENHGEGALLNGETGSFDMDLPAAGVREVLLRSELVDLGAAGRVIIAPGKPR
jgi:hypothetical protein